MYGIRCRKKIPVHGGTEGGLNAPEIPAGYGFWRGKKFFAGHGRALAYGRLYRVPVYRASFKGVPENEFPFPYLEKPLIFLMLTLLWYLVLYRLSNKKTYLRKREKKDWMS